MKELKGISHKKHGLFFGVGIMDYDGLVWVNGKNINSYVAWLNMLHRCYDKKYLSKSPTYRNCSVCKEWLYFSRFKAWYDSNYIDGYHLDKDLFQKDIGYKVYSPQTCCFLPKEINNLLISEKRIGSELPRGVYRVGKNTFRVRLLLGKKSFEKYGFTNVSDAIYHAKSKKFEYVRNISFKMYKKGEISLSIYNAIINYFKV